MCIFRIAIVVACALAGWQPSWAQPLPADRSAPDVPSRPPAGDASPLGKFDDNAAPSAEQLPGHSLGATFLFTVLECAGAPLLVPAAALHDDYSQDVRFARFPYDETDGYLMLGPEPVDLKELQEQSSKGDSDPRAPEKPFDAMAPEGFFLAGRLSGEYAGNGDGLSQIGGQLLLSTAGRLGMDTQLHYFNEQFPDRGGDHLWLGDWNLVFRFAQSEHAEFRTGFGFNWLADSSDTNFGFNWTYGADFYPVKPWILSTSFDLGRLGDVGLFHGRATVGVIVNRFEVYTGYDYYDIGRVGISSLVGGVRLWF